MSKTLSKNQLEAFFSSCSKLSSLISEREEKLVGLLSKYETHETVRDELFRAQDALQGARKEFEAIQDPLSGLKIATIFPLNLPLYSLVIFGVMPSAFSSSVYIRPPEIMREILTQLWDILEINTHFPCMKLAAVPRHVFVKLYAAECDAIIFTGKYSNAMQIHKLCPDSLLIYNGSGVNPFLIFKNADLALAAEKAVEMRCFNSGQDCAGPDAFFVPSSIADEFVEKIKAELEHVKVGDPTDPSVRVGPTMKEAYITELKEWLNGEKLTLVYGGEIDEPARLVHPGIIRRNVDEVKDLSFHEFFAPYFYIMEYDSVEALQRVLQAPEFRRKGMYISVFGDNAEVEKTLDYVQLLKNVNVNDVERGNKEYGGYGSIANFLLYGDEKIVHPILISRDLHKILSGRE